MRLICLNIWGGKIYEPLIEFIKKHKDQTDIFCFQESYTSQRNELLSLGMYSNINGDIGSILTDFRSYFYSTLEGEDVRKKVDFPLSSGQITFVRNDLNVLKSGEIYTYRSFNNMGPRYVNGEPDFPKNFIFCEIKKGDKKFLVLNFHGFWNLAPKSDTPERIKQSQTILDFVEKDKLPTIVAGDFNLRMETRSISMFEEAGFRNLVKEFGIPTTRSNLYDIKWRVNDPYADYIFTTKGIIVKDFKVLGDEVSDHLPLYLEFEI